MKFLLFEKNKIHLVTKKRKVCYFINISNIILHINCVLFSVWQMQQDKQLIEKQAILMPVVAAIGDQILSIQIDIVLKVHMCKQEKILDSWIHCWLISKHLCESSMKNTKWY